MENIEYLDEYKDLIPEDSSSIDADIFQELFRGQLNDDELDDVPSASQQRCRSSSSSSDSNDALDALYNRNNQRTKPKKRNRQESLDSIDDLGATLMRQVPKAATKKSGIKPVAPKKSVGDSSNSASSSFIKSGPNIKGRPPINTKPAGLAKKPTSLTAIKSKTNESKNGSFRGLKTSSDSYSMNLKKKPVTIIKPPPSTQKKSDADERRIDPLRAGLHRFLEDSDSDAFEYESDSYDEGDTDDYERDPVIDLSTDSSSAPSVADDVTPVVSEDEGQQQRNDDNDHMELYLSNLSKAEYVQPSPLSENLDRSRNLRDRQTDSTTPESDNSCKEREKEAYRAKEVAAAKSPLEGAKAILGTPSSSNESTTSRNNSDMKVNANCVDEDLSYDKVQRMSLELAAAIKDIDENRTLEFEKRSAYKTPNSSDDSRVSVVSTSKSHVRKLTYSASDELSTQRKNGLEIRRVKSDTGLTRGSRNKPTKKRVATTDEPRKCEPNNDELTGNFKLEEAQQTNEGKLAPDAEKNEFINARELAQNVKGVCFKAKGSDDELTKSCLVEDTKKMALETETENELTIAKHTKEQVEGNEQIMTSIAKVLFEVPSEVTDNEALMVCKIHKEKIAPNSKENEGLSNSTNDCSVTPEGLGPAKEDSKDLALFNNNQDIKIGFVLPDGLETSKEAQEKKNETLVNVHSSQPLIEEITESLGNTKEDKEFVIAQAALISEPAPEPISDEIEAFLAANEESSTEDFLKDRKKPFDAIKEIDNFVVPLKNTKAAENKAVLSVESKKVDNIVEIFETPNTRRTRSSDKTDKGSTQKARESSRAKCATPATTGRESRSSKRISNATPLSHKSQGRSQLVDSTPVKSKVEAKTLKTCPINPPVEIQKSDGEIETASSPKHVEGEAKDGANDKLDENKTGQENTGKDDSGKLKSSTKEGASGSPSKLANNTKAYKGRKTKKSHKRKKVTQMQKALETCTSDNLETPNTIESKKELSNNVLEQTTPENTDHKEKVGTPSKYDENPRNTCGDDKNETEIKEFDRNDIEKTSSNETNAANSMLQVGQDDKKLNLKFQKQELESEPVSQIIDSKESHKEENVSEGDLPGKTKRKSKSSTAKRTASGALNLKPGGKEGSVETVPQLGNESTLFNEVENTITHTKPKRKGKKRSIASIEKDAKVSKSAQTSKVEDSKNQMEGIAKTPKTKTFLESKNPVTINCSSLVTPESSSMIKLKPSAISPTKSYKKLCVRIKKHNTPKVVIVDQVHESQAEVMEINEEPSDLPENETETQLRLCSSYTAPNAKTDSLKEKLSEDEPTGLAHKETETQLKLDSSDADPVTEAYLPKESLSEEFTYIPTIETATKLKLDSSADLPNEFFVAQQDENNKIEEPLVADKFNSAQESGMAPSADLTHVTIVKPSSNSLDNNTTITKENSTEPAIVETCTSDVISSTKVAKECPSDSFKDITTVTTIVEACSYVSDETSVGPESSQVSADISAIDNASPRSSESTQKFSAAPTGVTTVVKQSNEFVLTPKRSLRKRKAEASQPDEAAKRRQLLGTTLSPKPHQIAIVPKSTKIVTTEFKPPNAKPEIMALRPEVRRRLQETPDPPQKRSKPDDSNSAVKSHEKEKGKPIIITVTLQETETKTKTSIPSAKTGQTEQKLAAVQSVDKPVAPKTTAAIGAKTTSQETSKSSESVKSQEMPQKLRDEIQLPLTQTPNRKYTVARTHLTKSGSTAKPITSQETSKSSESVKSQEMPQKLQDEIQLPLTQIPNRKYTVARTHLTKSGSTAKPIALNVMEALKPTEVSGKKSLGGAAKQQAVINEKSLEAKESSKEPNLNKPDTLETEIKANEVAKPNIENKKALHPTVSKTNARKSEPAKGSSILNKKDLTKQLGKTKKGPIVSPATLPTPQENAKVINTKTSAKAATKPAAKSGNSKEPLQLMTTKKPAIIEPVSIANTVDETPVPCVTNKTANVNTNRRNRKVAVPTSSNKPPELIQPPEKVSRKRKLVSSTLTETPHVNAKRPKASEIIKTSNIAFPVRLVAASEELAQAVTVSETPAKIQAQTTAPKKQKKLQMPLLPQPVKLRKVCVLMNRRIVRNWLKLLESASKKKTTVLPKAQEVSAVLAPKRISEVLPNSDTTIANIPQAIAAMQTVELPLNVDLATVLQPTQSKQQAAVTLQPTPAAEDVKPEEDIELEANRDGASQAPEAAIVIRSENVQLVPVTSTTPTLTATVAQGNILMPPISHERLPIRNSISNSSAESNINCLANTNIFSFLYPARSSGNLNMVGLDYCCPNLDGPMRAIDPTRIHDKVGWPVLNLPQTVVVTTVIVSKKSPNIPNRVRAILAANEAKSSLAQPLGAEKMLTPVEEALPPIENPSIAKQLLSKTINDISQKSITSKTTQAKGVSTEKAIRPQPKPRPVAKNNVPSTGDLNKSTKTTQSNLLQLPTICPTDMQRIELQANVQIFDSVLQNLSKRVVNLTVSDRERTINEFVKNSILMPVDVEVGTKLLQNYITYLNVATKGISQKNNNTSGGIRNTSSGNLLCSTTSTSTMPSTPRLPPAIATTQTTARVAASGRYVTQRSSLQANLPIYTSSPQIIGYRLPGGATAKQITATTHVGTTSLTSRTITSGSITSHRLVRLPETIITRTTKPNTQPLLNTSTGNTKVLASVQTPLGVAGRVSEPGTLCGNTFYNSNVGNATIVQVNPSPALRATNINNSTLASITAQSSVHNRNSNVANLLVAPTTSRASFPATTMSSAGNNLFIVNHVSSQPEECILPDSVATNNGSVGLEEEIKEELEDGPENLT